jgi:hypothetical protein
MIARLASEPSESPRNHVAGYYDGFRRDSTAAVAAI